MAEELRSAGQFEQLQIRSQENNGSTAVPMTPRGRVIDSLAAQFIKANYGDNSEVVLAAAISSHAISTGNRRSYCARPRSPAFNLPPDISTFSFANGLDQLPNYGTLPESVLSPSREEVIGTIEKIRRFFENVLQGKSLYSPYFRRNTAEAQIDVTEHVTRLHETLKQELAALQAGKESSQLGLNEPTRVIAVNGVIRAHLLPLSLPFNDAAGDFDSGYCDKGLSTSLGRGDQAVTVASFRNHRFISGIGVAGWVKSTDIAPLTEDLEKTLANSQTVFYTGSDPHFYTTGDGRNSVILPGDVLYKRSNRLAALNSDQDHGVSLTNISDIDHLVTAGIKTPQELVDFTYQLNLPYKWANFDCAEIMRRAFRMMGISVRKYSQDMMDDLLVLGKQPPITNPEALDSMADGLYLVNLLVPTGKEDGFTSTHLYLDAVQQGEHSVFSQAFQIVNDSGAIDTPVGPHRCSQAALKQQIRRGRRLTLARIAA